MDNITKKTCQRQSTDYRVDDTLGDGCYPPSNSNENVYI